MVSFDELFMLYTDDTNEIYFLNQRRLGQEVAVFFKSVGRSRVSKEIEGVCPHGHKQIFSEQERTF